MAALSIQSSWPVTTYHHQSTADDWSGISEPPDSQTQTGTSEPSTSFYQNYRRQLLTFTGVKV